MLQAKTENGKLLTLAMLSQDKIKHIRYRTNFYCPTCEEKVIVRAGPHMIPHFAHYSKSKCSSIKGGEGPYHEKGKLLLYKWLKDQNINVTLEKFLPEINQRPDLYLTVNGKRIVIEFQCSRISIKDIQKRNRSYQSFDINPIWILGATQFKRLSYNYLRVDAFTLQFIHQFNPQSANFLYYFCPNAKQFLVLSDLYLTSQKRAAHKLRISKLDKMSFYDLFLGQRFKREELMSLWKREKTFFRLRVRSVSRGKELTWVQWLYLKRSYIEWLPSEIYLPVSTQYLMKSSLWDWQSRLCLDIIESLHIGQSFTLQQCIYLLQNHRHAIREYPLIQSTVCPIQEYLNWLVHLRIIKETTLHHYKKLKSLTHYKHIEEAIEGDKLLFDKISSKKSNKI